MASEPSRTRVPSCSRPRSCVAALSMALALVACSGGGDGGGGDAGGLPPAPSAPVAITQSNGQAIGAFVVEAAILGIDPRGVLGVIFGIEARSVPAAAAVGAPAAAYVLARIPVRTTRGVGPRAISRRSFTEAAVTDACLVSGSVTYSATATSYSVTFNNCSDSAGEVVNGTLSATNIVESGDPFTGSASSDVSVDVSVTSSGTTARILGGFHFEESWTPTTAASLVTGTSFGFSDGVDTFILSDFALSDQYDDGTATATTSYDYTVASSELGGAVTVDTVSPFHTSYAAAYPHTGSAVVSGAGASKLRITMLGNETAPPPQVRIELDANGDGTYETAIELTWAALLAP